MKTLTLHEAKTQLSRDVGEAANGEPFVITQAVRPMVTVTSLEPPASPARKRLGCLAGALSIPDDFDTMGQAEIIRMFENG